MNKKYIYGDNECVSKYFKDIKKSKPLTSKEEIDLAIRIQNGDEDAIEKLVTANLKFVISIAKKYQRQGLELSDLISEGNEGLIKAALRFDPDEGYKFISYAVYWVKQTIIQSLNENSRNIRLPSNVINRLSKMRKAFERFEFENERKPTEGDIIVINNEDGTIDEIIYESDMPSCSSLNQTISEDGDELTEVLIDDKLDSPDDITLDENLITDELNKTLGVLDKRERKIVEMYYGLDDNYESMTLEAIGDIFELTKERVRQIKEKAIRKLRHNASDLHELIKENF